MLTHYTWMCVCVCVSTHVETISKHAFCCLYMLFGTKHKNEEKKAKNEHIQVGHVGCVVKVL